jgi:Mce-associated membrane protein
VEDQPADSGDLTTDPAATPTAEPAGKGGRRLLRWRRAKPAVGQRDRVSEETGDAGAGDDSTRRVPTGKARRAPKESVAAEADAPQTVEDATVTAETDTADTEAQTEPGAQTGADVETETGAEADTEGEEATEPEPEPVLVAHRPAGKRLLITAAAAAVLFVAGGAFAGATVAPYLADRAAVDTKLTIARTATEAITTLWTYTPDDMATLPDRSSRYLAGDFASEYRRYIDAIVATNKQAQVTNTTQVMGAAVESLTSTEATALVYTNSVATSPVNKNIPSLRYLSYRLTLERHDARWLITGMSSITSLDLTPQL